MIESKSTSKRLVGIDLFSGAGGMSLAATQAGIEVLFAVENCQYAARSYRLNFPSVRIFQGDVREVVELPKKPADAISVLFGGPPCQGFSTSNQRTRNSENDDNWLYEEFLRLAKVWSPDWVLMENVKGIVETEGGAFLSRMLQGLLEAGYCAHYTLLNAEDFGVPQRRTRLFVVGSKDELSHRFPRGTESLVTVEEAIGDLPVLPNGASVDILPYGMSESSCYARKLRGEQELVSGNLVTRNALHILERYRHIPPGGNWQDIPPELLLNYRNLAACHTGIYRRLNNSGPSVVIGNYRKNMLIHPSQDRGLSVREAARLQSVPDNFLFSGSTGFQQQQVGNMVPPNLGRAVFRSILG